MISADSNVFVYLYDDDEPGKQAVAREIVAELAQRGFPVALQVVGEVANALRRKLKKRPADAAQAGRDIMASFALFPPTATASAWALDQVGAAHMQYWDALLVAAARGAGVRALLSEDMADGAEVGGVLIVNPFGPDGLSPAARRLLEI